MVGPYRGVGVNTVALRTRPVFLRQDPGGRINFALLHYTSKETQSLRWLCPVNFKVGQKGGKYAQRIQGS